MRQIRKALFAVGAVVLILGSAAGAADNEATLKAREATQVLSEMLDIPDRAIPTSMFRNAYGVAVIPDVLKVGFFIGGRHGEGLFVMRTEGGGDDWSHPIFITLTGGSIGWQLGAQQADIILVFKTERSVEGILEGKITLGVDAAIAAGPLGRQAEASTDIDLEAEIFSYAKSKGFFAGLTIEGSVIQIDHGANDEFYGGEGLSPEDIIQGRKVRLPREGRDFLEAVRDYSRPAAEQEDQGPHQNERPAV